MTPKNPFSIPCLSTRKSFDHLIENFPTEVTRSITWNKDGKFPKNLSFRFLILELRPSERSLSRLKKIVKEYPDTEILAFSHDGSPRQAVEAIRAGASNYFSLPDEIDSIRRYLFQSLRNEVRKEEKESFHQRLKSRYDFGNIVGRSPELAEVLATAERVIHSGVSPILIRGETGTGKELLARAIHYNRMSSEDPFVEVNCGAIPGKLLESELFGYEKGAFTDAKSSKMGLFEVAHNGTIFLDEVGQLSPQLQVKLLQALEYRTIRRLGGTKSIPIDVRIIAATNADLEEAIREGNFRTDMFYRLNVVTLTLPPLRERGDDILLLAEHFVDRFVSRYGLGKKKLSARAKKVLIDHSWPGNVRELMNVIERSVILFEGSEIDEKMLLISGTEPKPERDTGAVSRLVIDIPETGVTREAVEKKLVTEILRISNGNKSRAARMLGVTRPTLMSMIRRYGIG